MKKLRKQKLSKVPRNTSALAAKSRTSGGPMKHRLEPKKGAKNEQAELLAELTDDEDEHEFEL